MTDFVTIIDTSGAFPANNIQVAIYSPDASQIIYSLDSGDTLVMNSNGTGSVNILPAGTAWWSLAWKPDGTVILGNDGDATHGIYQFAPDGSGLTQILAAGGHPSYSPSGTQIVYQAQGAGFSAIWIANADGSGATKIYETTSDANNPSWGSDNRIYFTLINLTADGSSLCSIDTAGGTFFQLTVPVVGQFDEWAGLSSDGTEVLFQSAVGFDPNDIYSVPPDGSLVTRLTIAGVSPNTSTNALHPSWEPASTNTYIFIGNAADLNSLIIRPDFTPRLPVCRLALGLH